MFILNSLLGAFNPAASVQQAQGMAQTAGKWAKTFGFNDDIKAGIGKVARPIRTPKEDDGFFAKLISQVTTLDLAAAGVFVAAGVKQAMDAKNPPGEDGIGIGRKLLGMVLNPISAVILFVVSRLSNINKWHLTNKEKLSEAKVLKPVRESRFEDYKDRQDKDLEVISTIMGSDKNIACFNVYGPQGSGKSQLARWATVKRVEQLKKFGDAKKYEGADSHEVDATRLAEHLKETRAQNEMFGGDALGGADTSDSLLDVVKTSSDDGSSVLIDDARYFFSCLQMGQLRLLQEILEGEAADPGGLLTTMPMSLKSVLYANKSLKGEDSENRMHEIKTILQRIFSVRMPIPEALIIDNIPKDIASRIRAGVRETFGNRSQSEQWKGCVERFLLNDEEMGYGMTDDEKSHIASYFGFQKDGDGWKCVDQSKIDYFIEKYPMVPRYIEHSTMFLGTFAYELRKQDGGSITNENLDEVFEKTILQKLAFSNFANSYTAPDWESEISDVGMYSMNEIFDVLKNGDRKENSSNSAISSDILLDAKSSADSVEMARPNELLRKFMFFTVDNNGEQQEVKLGNHFATMDNNTAISEACKTYEGNFGPIKARKIEIMEDDKVEVLNPLEFNNVYRMRHIQVDEGEYIVPILATKEGSEAIYRGYIHLTSDGESVVRVVEKAKTKEEFFKWMEPEAAYT